MKFSRKYTRLFFIIPCVLIVLVLMSFVFWFLTPSKALNVAVLDKTVPATAADSHSYLDDVSNNYRKHLGLYWLMDYLKIKENGETSYDYTKDYYGPLLNEANEIESNKSLTEITQVPDLLYLSDAYGVEIQDDRGITGDEINVISMCHSSGSTIIGEQDIYGTDTESDVANQLNTIFGIRQTGWVGRYIYDLADMTDVPYWAPDMYKNKYGQEWRLQGPGILLVSSDGNIIVLEEKTDFDTKNLITISMNEEYKKEFGKYSSNYYNWFELIEPDSSTEVLATYTFNVNSTGAELMAEVSDKLVFAAITRIKSENGNPAYYFAGDFNDYVTEKQIHNFVFADQFFKFLSVDREGDVTYFYWHFYVPLMKTILKDAADNTVSNNNKQVTEQFFRVNENKFEINIDGSWEEFDLKGFNINGEMPGNNLYEYSRNFDDYSQIIELAASELKLNCIRTYDLLPPEFYRALSEYNETVSEEERIYLIAGIKLPSDFEIKDFYNKNEEINKYIEQSVSALHGNGFTAYSYLGESTKSSYHYDVSPYIIGYIIDPQLSKGDISEIYSSNMQKSYTGKNISANNNPVNAILAQLADNVIEFNRDTYGYTQPVSVRCSVDSLSGASWTSEEKYTFNPSEISVSEDAKDLFYLSMSIKADDYALLNNEKTFGTYKDESGSYPYGGYVSEVKKLISLPSIVDSIGYSTNSDMFEGNASVNGLSETEQGSSIVRALKCIDKEQYIGALISDLNDNWAACSEEMKPFVIPYSSNSLWHNIADRTQTTGVLSVESVEPDEVELELNDSGKMQQMQIKTNETYVYLTLLLKEDINYDNNELIIGIDSYQRNDGEYYYDKNFYANSLSGMEYIVKFDGKRSASLYVVKSYNRNSNKFVSEESYDAAFDLVSVLEYGDFSLSNTHFYQTGSVLRIRIPWSMLNFTDPSSLLVISGGSKNSLKTVATDGMIFSVLIGDKSSKDTAYIFPESKQSAGYKIFKLSDWDEEDIEYSFRAKSSCTAIRRYFESL